jgi:hypothetical protein
VLALLIAQGGAQAHAYSHLQSGSDQSGLPGTRVQFCAECLLFAPLLATADCHDGSPILRLGDRALIAPPRVVSLVDRLSYYAFRSRAPPILR